MTTDNLTASVLEAYDRLGSAAAAAREMGIVERRAQRIVARARGPAAAPGFEIAQFSETRDQDGNLKSRSVRQVPERVDADAPEGMALRGVSDLEGPQGERMMRWRKWSKAAVRETMAVEELREALSGLRNVYAPQAPELVPAPLDAHTADCWVLYGLPDLHVGLRSYGKETGEDFDLDIAERELCDAFDRLVAFVPVGVPAASTIFMGDTFHTNSQMPLTAKSGNLLDMDGRWRKVFSTGARIACYMIERAAAAHPEVEVAVIPGNHDPDASRVLDVALSMRYADAPRISVPGTYGHHYFHRHGTCLVGATHGHTMKPERMASMLAEECSEAWAETQHRHMLFGHVHHETAKQVGSVRCESLVAPCARSSYEAAGGYASTRALTAIVYHRTLGEVARFRSPVGPLLA